MAYPQGFDAVGDGGHEGGQPADERLYAGKYKTPEELEKGYMNLLTVENQNRARLDALEQRFQADERVMPGERSASRAKRPEEEALEELGIPPATINGMIDYRVEERLAQALNPLIQGAQARETLRRSYPNFERLEQEVASFIEQHPDIKSRYSRMFQVDQGAAMQWAIDRYQDTTGARRENAGGSRGDAMLPGNTGGSGGRGQDLENVARSEAMQKAYQEGIRTGDWTQYQNLRLSEVIPDQHIYRGGPGRS